MMSPSTDKPALNSTVTAPPLNHPALLDHEDQCAFDLPLDGPEAKRPERLGVKADNRSQVFDSRKIRPHAEPTARLCQGRVNDESCSSAWLRRLGTESKQVGKSCVLIWLLLCLAPVTQVAGDDLAELIDTSCIHCHDEDTETRLDFSTLKREFANGQAYRKWVHVFDRVDRGEMPPRGEAQPDASVREKAIEHLKKQLHEASLKTQNEFGRVPSRRLSRIEYENTLHDLLGIGGDLARHLPSENESGSFDVIAQKQEMSSVHIRSLLKTADLALDEAIQLGYKPNMNPRKLDYYNSKYFQMWVDRPVRNGGGTVFKTDTDIVTFRGANYVLRSDHNGFRPQVAGKYKITIKAAAHQPTSSITVSLKRQNDKQGQSELFAAWDLTGSDYRELSTIKYLRPDDFFYVSADELDPAPDGKVIYNSQPAEKFKGEGVKFRSVIIEGPLETSWPPQRTHQLLSGIKWKFNEKNILGRAYQPQLIDDRVKHAKTIVKSFAEKTWHRKVSEVELEQLLRLSESGLNAKKDFVAAVRIPLRAMLVSPELLFLKGRPGQLEEVDLARRLSYFLWRSIPDAELLKLAKTNQFSKPDILTQQVDRMLADPKHKRFINDFLGQWLGLDKIDSTSPDTFLYPEYDDVLRNAMLGETREFFNHLIQENLSAVNLVDADFTFLNRRLAEHYKIDGVEGETMRKVALPRGSVRGGILSHASIHKLTANGTVTTPVKRGNFVLTNLLGLPPNPPPPTIGSIEPDTRGATTIRETLEKHKDVETCALCHRSIDPPGFAMECFDPVGTFRKRYRNSKEVKRERTPGLRFLHKDYTLGLEVDPSGQTPDGFNFQGIRDYKKHLAKSKEQIARNLVSQLIAFSTGAEVQFADREVVEEILEATKKKGYPVRSLIHSIVASRIFRNR